MEKSAQRVTERDVPGTALARAAIVAVMASQEMGRIGTSRRHCKRRRGMRTSRQLGLTPGLETYPSWCMRQAPQVPARPV